MTALAKTPEVSRALFQKNHNLPEKLTIKSTNAVILFNSKTLVYAFFNKRASKQSIYRKCSNLESLQSTINVLVEREGVIAAQKKKASAPHTLQVGDILSTSWGYEQTNVDFWQVIEKNGATMVTVREVLQESSQEENMSSHVIPRPSQFLNEKTYRCKVSSDNRLTVNNQYARLASFTTVEATGTKIYKPQYRSYYH